MPKDNQTDPRKNFVPRFLPWLLGAAMFAVYFFTLNPWLSLMNLFPVAQVSGYIWSPQIYGPLTWLATVDCTTSDTMAAAGPCGTFDCCRMACVISVVSCAVKFAAPV